MAAVSGCDTDITAINSQYLSVMYASDGQDSCALQFSAGDLAISGRSLP